VSSEVIWRERQKKKAGRQTRLSVLTSGGQETEGNGGFMGSVCYIAFVTKQTSALNVRENRRAYWWMNWAEEDFFEAFPFPLSLIGT
jgi:hypothetical protein